MKKLFLSTLTVILWIPIICAQNKGDKYIGGIIGIATSSISIDGSSASQTAFGFIPEFGYFASDKLCISGSLGYELLSEEGQAIHALTIGPSIAYYVRLCDRFYYTPKLAVGFALGSTEGTSGSGFNAGLSLGMFEIKPATHIGISFNLFSLDYSHLSYSGTTANGITFKLGINPTVGFKYYF